MNTWELAVIGELAGAIDDEYGMRPTRVILQLAYGERVGKAIDELITIQRAYANAAIPGFEFEPDEPLTQDECDDLGLDGRDGHGTYTRAAVHGIDEIVILMAMGIDYHTAAKVVRDPRYKGHAAR